MLLVHFQITSDLPASAYANSGKANLSTLTHKNFLYVNWYIVILSVLAHNKGGGKHVRPCTQSETDRQSDPAGP